MNRYFIISNCRIALRFSQAFKEYRMKRNPMLRGRKNEILLPFKFWGEIEPREDKWIYEMRSYALEVLLILLHLCFVSRLRIVHCFVASFVAWKVIGVGCCLVKTKQYQKCIMRDSLIMSRIFCFISFTGLEV